MTKTYTTAPPEFINMTVLVEARKDHTGNAAAGAYHVTCTPSSLLITAPDTIINFQLIEPTAPAIRFTGMTDVERSSVPQFSVPSIALNGKQMTVCDANTINEKIAVTLDFSDDELKFSFDPQVENNPHP